MSKVLLLLLVLIAAPSAAAEDFREAVPIGLGGGATASKAVDAVIAPDGAQTVAFMRGG
ncbi:MAG: hypothetical protein JWM73_1568, partial [Solirubrobacterales bacterium]|nr:hypothetical protein [Solirubrobacterales bacterium]